MILLTYPSKSIPAFLILIAMLLALFTNEVWTSAAAGCASASFRSTPIFNTGSNPNSLTNGDFNQDGRADLAVINSGNENVSIFLANAANSFEVPQKITVGATPRGIATADFNGDGKLDLVTAVFSGGASVALGNGIGGFGAATNFPAGINPTFVVVADFNADSKLDLALANSSGGTVSILLGNGSGGFGSPTDFPVGANPRHITVANFNNDANLDLAVVNTNTMNVSILLGTGSGTFGAATNFSVGASPLAGAAGDFNADGKIDLAVANSTSNNVSILIGNGLGAFGTATTVTTGQSPTSIVVNDYTGDGKPDLAVSVAQINSVAVLAGNGNGGFLSPKYYGVAGGPQALTSGDFNNDGKLDLATADFLTGTVSLLRGLGQGKFDGTFNIFANQDPNAITIADFNKDGNQDFAVVNLSQQDIVVYLGDGTGDFGTGTSFDALHDASNVMAADVNGDDNLDLIGIGHTMGVIVLLGNGQGGFTHFNNFFAGSFGVETVAGDFNHDGKVDVAIADNSANGALVMLGNGAGSFAQPVTYPSGVGAAALSSGDFNEDGHTDLVVANTSDSVSILLADGNGSFLPRTNLTAGIRPFSVAVTDLNSDGHADLAVANQTSNQVSILIGDGHGNFSAATNHPADPVTNSILAADLNGDGNTDIATANPNAFGPLGTVSLFWGDGTGIIGPAANITMGRGSDDLAAGDFNNDAKMDLAVTNRTTRTTSILINTCQEAQATVSKLTISDVNVTEGATAAFNVNLTSPSNQIVSVSYFTGGGTASAGVDYGVSFGRLVFPVGVTTKTVTVPVFGDGLTEGAEAFNVFLADPLNASLQDAKGNAVVTDSNEPALALNNTNIAVDESAGAVVLTVTRTGNLGAPSTVNYVTQGNSASDRSDFTEARGTLRFNAGESAKTITLLIADDRFDEPAETFTVGLSTPVAATLGANQSSTITINDNDTTSGPSPVKWDSNFDVDFFIRQHYRDFLNREADTAGFNFWKDQINQCETRPEPERPGCREVRRVNVSAAFFFAIEFQETGYLVYRTFGASFGTTRVGGKVPVTFDELLQDKQLVSDGVIVNAVGWEQLLEANKVAYFNDFVQRQQFLTVYPETMSAASFVDALNSNSHSALSQSERDLLVTQLANATKTRAQVLRAIVEDQDFVNSERSRAFVLMEYFGYLRRDPNQTPDSDFSGYDFWLTKLNEHNGNFVTAEMVKAFLTSGEYSNRFGL